MDKRRIEKERSGDQEIYREGKRIKERKEEEGKR